MTTPPLVAVPYLRAMRDPNIAAADYEGASWDAWWVIHAALDAEPPPVDRVPHWEEIWATIAGGRAWPTVRPKEASLIKSRRIGGTRETARRGAWSCVTFDTRLLTAGETGVFQLTAADRAQSTIALGYARAFLEQSPLLASMIEDATKTEIRFTNRTVMRVATANFRLQRGWTGIGFANDETAYWYDGETSANPASEIFASQRPAMATIPTAQMLGATTPRARTGEVYRIFEQSFGKADPRTLVLRVPWHIGNPLLDPEMIRAQEEQDLSVARAEWHAAFRDDLESFLPRETVMACVVPHRGDLPPVTTARVEWFTDPAGGSGGDSFTLAGAMTDRKGCTTIVCLAERKPPFSPDEVTREFAEIIKRYGGHRVTGDRYAGEWPRERFRAHGISYDISERTKTEIYQGSLVLLTAGIQRLELPDNRRLINQICSLERRVTRGGRESIDAVGHEDLSNAALGAALLSSEHYHPPVTRPGTIARLFARVRCADRTHPTYLLTDTDQTRLDLRVTNWRCNHERLARNGGTIDIHVCGARTAISTRGPEGGPAPESEESGVRVLGL